MNSNVDHIRGTGSNFYRVEYWQGDKKETDLGDEFSGTILKVTKKYLQAGSWKLSNKKNKDEDKLRFELDVFFRDGTYKIVVNPACVSKGILDSKNPPYCHFHRKKVEGNSNHNRFYVTEVTLVDSKIKDMDYSEFERKLLKPVERFLSW